MCILNGTLSEPFFFLHYWYIVQPSLIFLINRSSIFQQDKWTFFPKRDDAHLNLWFFIFVFVKWMLQITERHLFRAISLIPNRHPTVQNLWGKSLFHDAVICNDSTLTKLDFTPDLSQKQDIWRRDAISGTSRKSPPGSRYSECLFGYNRTILSMGQAFEYGDDTFNVIMKYLWGRSEYLAI